MIINTLAGVSYILEEIKIVPSSPLNCTFGVSNRN